MPTDTSCQACGTTYPASRTDVWRCKCGNPLDFATTPVPSGPAPRPESLDRNRGLWAFTAFLPMTRAVSLGEGFTPLIPSENWNASFKLEYVSPTGSFKDRGATTTLSRAATLGVDRIVEDSSGNAGAAIATYAARAGIPAEIYVPASAKPGKLRAIERTGANVIRIEGSRRDVTSACVERVREGTAWYASHAWNPAFLAGTSTFALEICAQREWNAPDAIVCPIGHGTLFLGAYRGFHSLRTAGWIDSLPRLLGVQAAGYAPIASALHGESTDQNDLADGIQIREPARREQITAAIDATNGDVIALGDAPVAASLETLHEAGFYCEPTSAIAPAALTEYRERGVIGPDADVVVPLTGSGLKTS